MEPADPERDHLASLRVAYKTPCKKTSLDVIHINLIYSLYMLYHFIMYSIVS